MDIIIICSYIIGNKPLWSKWLMFWEICSHFEWNKHGSKEKWQKIKYIKFTGWYLKNNHRGLGVPSDWLYTVSLGSNPTTFIFNIRPISASPNICSHENGNKLNEYTLKIANFTLKVQSLYPVIKINENFWSYFSQNYELYGKRTIENPVFGYRKCNISRFRKRHNCIFLVSRS